MQNMRIKNNMQNLHAPFADVMCNTCQCSHGHDTGLTVCRRNSWRVTLVKVSPYIQTTSTVSLAMLLSAWASARNAQAPRRVHSVLPSQYPHSSLSARSPAMFVHFSWALKFQRAYALQPWNHNHLDWHRHAHACDLRRLHDLAPPHPCPPRRSARAAARSDISSLSGM
jgi:hypothetical protein